MEYFQLIRMMFSDSRSVGDVFGKMHWTTSGEESLYPNIYMSLSWVSRLLMQVVPWENFSTYFLEKFVEITHCFVAQKQPEHHCIKFWHLQNRHLKYVGCMIGAFVKWWACSKFLCWFCSSLHSIWNEQSKCSECDKSHHEGKIDKGKQPAWFYCS